VTTFYIFSSYVSYFSSSAIVNHARNYVITAACLKITLNDFQALNKNIFFVNLKKS